MMSITIRLDKELDEFINSESEREGISKSELIRNCIKEYFDKIKSRKTPYETGKNYFGKFDSGNPYLSKSRKKIIREKIHAKKSNY